MTNLKKSITQLFDNWARTTNHKGNIFIKDGIIDYELWNNSQLKIVFLLKEAYGNEIPNKWDLSSYINNKRKASGRTFKPLGQWAYGIFGLYEKEFIHPFPTKTNQQDINKALSSCALVNIKKSGGKKRSNHNNLNEYLENDWGYLSEQLDLIEPQIIICGKTWDLIKKKLNGYEKVSDQVYKHDGRYYVDYWHPANRASKIMNYYALCALIQQSNILEA